jgi:hypothetical protein
MPAINIFAGMARSYTIGISVVFNENWNYWRSQPIAGAGVRWL